jgi:formylglycine-generating enzyme required for sulfatase activity
MTLDLRRAVRRPDLWRLAPNPLLLTVMALVHTHKGRLPDARALLYEDAVDILLWRWEQMKLGRDSETSGLRQLMLRAGVSDVDLKRALWQLAFEAHRQGGAEARLADIGEVALQDALAAIYPVKQESRAWVGEVIETIKLRAGLLVERTTHVFTFPHRTFQEYLAGAFLASLPDFAIRSAALAKEGGQWRDVILLAVGRLVYLSGDIYKPLGLVSELCPAQRTPFTDEAWRCAWLAGDVIVETGLQRAFGCALGQELVARVRRHLVALVETGALTPVEQAAVGVTLGKLGDSRKGVGVMARECGCALPDIDWVEVPPGPFVMGSKEDDSSWGDERPQFTCDLIAKPYRVSRYPITVAQFRCFVEARGYENERFWTGAGWAWRQKESVTGPEDYGEVFQTPNHPRVGVSWYEAMAFCAWLAAELGLRIGLPSEPEWERAARHTDGRLYPWGNEQAVKSRCNMGDTGIGSTSAVGLFPSGAAICGAEDMAGNVWEWCRTAWTSDYEDYERRVNSAPETSGRVVRGGSFGDSSRYCRCAFRLRVIPNDRDVSLGFRVLASPVS